jgi:hypothetical protein
MAGKGYGAPEAADSEPDMAGKDAIVDDLWEALQSGDKEKFKEYLHEYVERCMSEGEGEE